MLSNKYKRLGKNTFFVFVGNASAKLLGLLMLPFYTSWLTVDDYGLTDILTVYAVFLLNIVSCCISEAIFIFPKDVSKAQQRSYFSSGLSFAGVAFLLLFILFSCINIFVYYYDFHNSFVDNLSLIYAMLVAMFIQQYMQQFVRSIDKMKVYSITGIVLTITTALFSFFLIPEWGVKGYIFAIVLANLVSSFYTFYFSKAYLFWNIRSISKKHCLEMLRYSIPMVPNGIMWWLVSAFNRPLMEGNLGLQSVGLFAVANKFPGILSMIFAVFFTSWQISVIEEFKKEDYESFFNKMLRLVVIVLFVIFVMLTLCCKYFIFLLVEPAYYEAWKFIPVLTLGAVLLSISGMLGSNYLPARQSKYFFYTSVWGAASAIIFNLLLIPVWGIMGASVSILLSFGVTVLTRAIYAKKYVRIKNLALYMVTIMMAICVIVSNLFLEDVYNLAVVASLLSVFFLLNYKYFVGILGLMKQLGNRLRGQ